MAEYTVLFMTPYATYENVEATNEDEAIRKCEMPAEFDANEPHMWMAICEKED